jgi:dTDP-4-dehydrorhamnose 3,5-epimerase
LKFNAGKLQGSYVIALDKRVDERGYFVRRWCQQEFRANGLMDRIAQINCGFSPRAGTLRGLHFQKTPFAEIKVVSCTRGTVLDVVVDLRSNSSTYRQWMAVELCADDGQLVYVPEGCAHGYLTLSDDSVVEYLTSQFYAPESASGVRYDDPAFGIAWPRSVDVVSKADRSWPDYGDP